MKISYLNYFQKALDAWLNLYPDQQIFHQALSQDQIEVVEKVLLDNQSDKLPLVLRELLVLTGSGCPFFSTGMNLNSNEKESMDASILLKDQFKNPYFQWLKAHGGVNHFKGRIIWSLFTEYESSDSFHFIYLDENDNDPLVYSFDTDAFYEGGLDLISENIESIESTEARPIRLSELIVELYTNYCRIHYSRPPYKETEILGELNLETLNILVSEGDLAGLQNLLRGTGFQSDLSILILKAISISDVEIVEFLTQHHLENLKSADDWILTAAQSGNPIVLKYLLAKYSFSQLAINKSLIHACSRGIKLSVEMIIHNGGEVNAFNSLAFQIALRNGHLVLARVLVSDYGANHAVNNGFVGLFRKEIRDDFSQTILLKGIKENLRIEKVLKMHEEDMRLFFKEGYNPKNFKKIGS